jgi:hypothetical protein
MMMIFFSPFHFRMAFAAFYLHFLDEFFILSRSGFKTSIKGDFRTHAVENKR